MVRSPVRKRSSTRIICVNAGRAGASVAAKMAFASPQESLSGEAEEMFRKALLRSPPALPPGGPQYSLESGSDRVDYSTGADASSDALQGSNLNTMSSLHCCR